MAGGEALVGVAQWPPCGAFNTGEEAKGAGTFITLPRHCKAMRLKLGVPEKSVPPEDSPNERDRSS